MSTKSGNSKWICPCVANRVNNPQISIDQDFKNLRRDLLDQIKGPYYPASFSHNRQLDASWETTQPEYENNSLSQCYPPAPHITSYSEILSLDRKVPSSHCGL